MTTARLTLIPVQVHFAGHDWTNEFTVRSPSGACRTVHCNGLWGEMSGDLKTLINNYQHADAADYRWGSWADLQMPLPLMKEVAHLAARGDVL